MTYQEKTARIYEAMSDKELSLWCVFVDKYHRDNDDALQYNTVIHLGDEIDWCRLVYYTADFARWSVQHKFAHYLRWERKEYRKTQKNEWDLRYEVIWHPIHIWVVLDWIDKNTDGDKFSRLKWWRECNNYGRWASWNSYFDLTQQEELKLAVMLKRKDKTKPLPLNPTEERYPVIDFITSLLDWWT